MPSNKTSPVNSICARGNINSLEADYIKIHIKKNHIKIFCSEI